MDRDLEYFDISEPGPARRERRRRLPARVGAYAVVALVVAGVGIAPRAFSDDPPVESATEIGRGRSPQIEQLPNEAAPPTDGEAVDGPAPTPPAPAPAPGESEPPAPADAPAPAPADVPVPAAATAGAPADLPAPAGESTALPPLVAEAPAAAPQPAGSGDAAPAGDEPDDPEVLVAAQTVEASPATPTPATAAPDPSQPGPEEDAARAARREARREWFRAALRRYREHLQPLRQEFSLVPPVTTPAPQPAQGSVQAQAAPSSPVHEAPPTPAPRPEPRNRFTTGSRTPVGVYRGSEPHLVAEYERWLGAEVGWVLDFINGESWDTIRDPDHHVNLWDDTDYEVVFSLPMLPKRGGATLEAGARGDYDHHFREVARSFVRNGRGDAVIRLGWELNAKGMPWFAGGKEQAYVRYWRRVVDVFRAESDDFRFDWSPMALGGKADVEAAYPGDGYVDIIGLDAYEPWKERGDTAEKRWEILRDKPYGLVWQRDFAAARGKPISFPEWGVTRRADGKAAGDSPYYIEQMAKWIKANDVAYAMYFEKNPPDGDHQLMTDFPKSREAYKRHFGQ